MRTRSIGIAVAAWVIFGLAVGWPAVALVERMVADGVAPRDGWWLTPRQGMLLLRSVWMAAAAAVVCVLCSVPGACLMGRRGWFSGKTLLVAALAATLFCPPMVSVFGWLELPIVTRGGAGWCVCAWSLWGWPVASMLIGSAWSRQGRSAYEAALLDGGGFRALMKGALPTLYSSILLSVVILFVLFFNDYGVPHAMGLTVYATELLVAAGSSNRPIDTFWPALPGVLISGALLAAILWRSDAAILSGVRRGAGGATSWRMTAASLFLGVLWLVPLAMLVVAKGSWDKARHTVVVYSGDALATLWCALAAGALVMLMGALLSGFGRTRRAFLAGSLCFGFLPGALVGHALIAAYNRNVTGLLYDHWPIVVVGYVARFAWLGILLCPQRSGDDRLVEQATVDGASGWRLFWRVVLPLRGPVLLGGGVVVVALSVAELPTTTLVRVPDFTPVSILLLEKFHRFEDGILVALSLSLVGAAFLAALVVGWLTARRRWG